MTPLVRVNSVIAGFEAGRNCNGDMVSNVAARLFYVLRDDLTALVAENARLKGERDGFHASERELSQSYLRIRAMLNAFGTNHGGENRFEVTEKAVEDVVARVGVLEGALRFADDTFRDLGWHAKWEVTSAALAAALAQVPSVERFDLEQPDSHMGSAYMRSEPAYGEWVRYTDMDAALKGGAA